MNSDLKDSLPSYNVIFETCPWYTRVAVMDEEGKLRSLHYNDIDEKFVEGTVILGRVRKLMPNLNAAFVDIGDTQDGFLPLNKLPKKQGVLHEGQEVMVRVDRPKSGEKGAKLDGRVLHDRPASSDIKIPSIIAESKSALSHALMDAGIHPVRVWVIDQRDEAKALRSVPEGKLYRFDRDESIDLLENLDEQLEAIEGPEFHISGGSHLTIEATKALTSIDIDSGSYIIKDKENMFLKVNILAAAEVARLCKLLNIGGNIIIDFITMRPKASRTHVRDFLKKSFLENDSKQVQVLDMSHFGILEINREMEGETLLDQLKKPAFVAGEILLKLWRFTPGRYDFCVECAPEVALILQKRLTTHAATAYLGSPVEIRPNSELFDNQYILSS